MDPFIIIIELLIDFSLTWPVALKESALAVSANLKVSTAPAEFRDTFVPPEGLHWILPR